MNKNRRPQASKRDRDRRYYDVPYRINLAGREASDFLLWNEQEDQEEQDA